MILATMSWEKLCALSSGKLVKSPSMKVFKRQVDVLPRDMVKWQAWQCLVNGLT